MKRSGFDFGGTRTCPSCENTYPTTLEEGGDYWYLIQTSRTTADEYGNITTTRTKIPDTYCKRCRNKMRSASRRAKKALEDLAAMDPVYAARVRIETMQGKCEVCGKRKKPRHRSVYMMGERLLGVCDVCEDMLDACHQSVTIARDYWLGAKRHMLDERHLDERKAKRCPGVRRAWHEENDDAPAIPHSECIMLERHWRAVAQFLSTQVVVTQ